MNNLPKNDSLEKTGTKEDSSLCKNCFKFFGNPQTNNMCSKCFK